MKQNCKRCGIKYDSEGHELKDWLTLCLDCNHSLTIEQKHKLEVTK